MLLNVHGGRDHSDVTLLKVDNLGAPEGLSGPDPDVSGASTIHTWISRRRARR